MSTVIACCMITRDRAELALRAMESVGPHVDHVFVYDTGSVDDTVERLAALDGVTVERGEWRENFSVARSASFAMPGPEYDWLAWMDDDDVVAGTDVLHDLVAEAPPAVGILAVMVESGDVAGRRERVVRRACGLRWEGSVHERLVPPPGVAIRPLNVDTERLRWVHQPGPRTDPGRNLRILDDEVWADGRARRPSNPRTLFYPGVEATQYWNATHNDELLAKIRRALEFSITGQAQPQRLDWLPLPPNLLEALPPDVVELFHQAGGVG
jgi:glycosyltransferase involved in cell wall biosynthesis